MTSDSRPAVRKQLTWVSFFEDPGELERSPRVGDIVDDSAALRNLLIATAVAVVAIVLCIVLPRIDGGSFWLLDLVGAVVFFLWLFLVLPNLLAHRFSRRWRRAYRKLSADPRRASASELLDLELRWDRSGGRCTVMRGRIAYTAADGSAHEAPLISSAEGGRSPSFHVRLPCELAPSTASSLVVWHAPDHSVVHSRVLVGPATSAS